MSSKVSGCNTIAVGKSATCRYGESTAVGNLESIRVSTDPLYRRHPPFWHGVWFWLLVVEVLGVGGMWFFSLPRQLVIAIMEVFAPSIAWLAWLALGYALRAITFTILGITREDDWDGYRP